MPSFGRSEFVGLVTMIEAAGGVVWRRSSKGAIKVLLVHRPRYDDWSLPKGKLDPGETHRHAALREVEEETGLRCETHDELDEVRYVDRKGRPKRVRYWSMEPLDGSFEPNDEVDEVRWVLIDDVGRHVTYKRDATVVDGLRQLAS
jgi:8-oxo-dGTP pyrophosphatase MutT (NUDIX family)